MHRDLDHIPVERMLLAVDAIFEALREMETDRLRARPAALMGAPDQPRAFCEFTRDEIEAASDFLERMDSLPVATDRA